MKMKVKGVSHPFFLNFKKFFEVFDGITICMCKQYQILETVYKKIKMESPGYQVIFQLNNTLTSLQDELFQSRNWIQINSSYPVPIGDKKD